MVAQTKSRGGRQGAQPTCVCAPAPAAVCCMLYAAIGLSTTLCCLGGTACLTRSVMSLCCAAFDQCLLFLHYAPCKRVAQRAQEAQAPGSWPCFITSHDMSPIRHTETTVLGTALPSSGLPNRQLRSQSIHAITCITHVRSQHLDPYTGESTWQAFRSVSRQPCNCSHATKEVDFMLLFGAVHAIRRRRTMGRS